MPLPLTGFFSTFHIKCPEKPCSLLCLYDNGTVKFCGVLCTRDHSLEKL